MAPRYALLERERRWLAMPHALALCDEKTCRLLDDRYLIGTRLRLRAVHGPGGEVIYKLGCKYESADPTAVPVVSIYLSQAEYHALHALPAHASRKRRYRLADGSLDVYEPPHAGLAIFEREFGSPDELQGYRAPTFAGAEITGEASFTGFALAARRFL
jgi:hypothetical protein